MAYNSAYVARIIRTGKLIFTAATHDRYNETDCWFSSDDGSSRDCMFVMDNKQFNQMLKNREVEYVKTPADPNQLTIEL